MIQIPCVLALVPPAHLLGGNVLDHLLVSRDVLGALRTCWEPQESAGIPKNLVGAPRSRSTCMGRGSPSPARCCQPAKEPRLCPAALTAHQVKAQWVSS